MLTCTPGDEVPLSMSCFCHSPAFARINAMVERKITRRAFVGGAGAAFGAAALWPPQAFAAMPQGAAVPIVFTNVRLFDGTSSGLVSGKRVTVSGNRITAVGDDTQPAAEGVTVIDGGGRTLMPGLIDAHWHTMMASLPMSDLMTADVGYINLAAAEEARKTLLRGFTSVRDVGGPAFGLKRAIDSGLTAGPRIWPSGAMISQTSGHADFRMPHDVPAERGAPLSRAETLGAGMIADGVDEVLKRVREQLMLAASQIKVHAGGGVASTYDPIDVSEYTEAEFRAAVEAAENWGTYVTVHAYTPRAIQTAVRAGVRCVEHGQLMDDETASIMADKGVWLSAQAFLNNEYSNPQSTPLAEAKAQQVYAGTDAAYGFAKKHGLKTAWGTDILFNSKMTANQGAILATLTRWYSPIEILKMATGTNAQLLAMSGLRSPYPSKVGVIEPDTYADLLLIDGDPIADMKLIGDPEKNLKVIMKDGWIYKNTLA